VVDLSRGPGLLVFTVLSKQCVAALARELAPKHVPVSKRVTGLDLIVHKGGVKHVLRYARSIGPRLQIASAGSAASNNTINRVSLQRVSTCSSKGKYVF
jgi:hypothetical protein